MPNPEITLKGNLASQPELKKLSTGSLLKFRVITNDWVKDQSGNWSNKDTSGWNIEVWGEKADKLSKHLKKGSGVMVMGKMRERLFEDKDGNKRSVVEVKADSVALDISSIEKDSGTSWDGDSTWNATGDTPF
jgi:single-strand DNA-binding protein